MFDVKGQFEELRKQIKHEYTEGLAADQLKSKPGLPVIYNYKNQFSTAEKHKLLTVSPEGDVVAHNSLCAEHVYTLRGVLEALYHVADPTLATQDITFDLPNKDILYTKTALGNYDYESHLITPPRNKDDSGYYYSKPEAPVPHDSGNISRHDIKDMVENGLRHTKKYFGEKSTAQAVSYQYRSGTPMPTGLSGTLVVPEPVLERSEPVLERSEPVLERSEPVLERSELVVPKSVTFNMGADTAHAQQYRHPDAVRADSGAMPHIPQQPTLVVRMKDSYVPTKSIATQTDQPPTRVERGIGTEPETIKPQYPNGDPTPHYPFGDIGSRSFYPPPQPRGYAPIYSGPAFYPIQVAPRAMLPPPMPVLPPPIPQPLPRGTLTYPFPGAVNPTGVIGNNGINLPFMGPGTPTGTPAMTAVNSAGLNCLPYPPALNQAFYNNVPQQQTITSILAAGPRSGQTLITNAPPPSLRRF